MNENRFVELVVIVCALLLGLVILAFPKPEEAVSLKNCNRTLQDGLHRLADLHERVHCATTDEKYPWWEEQTYFDDKGSESYFQCCDKGNRCLRAHPPKCNMASVDQFCIGIHGSVPEERQKYRQALRLLEEDCEVVGDYLPPDSEVKMP